MVRFLLLISLFTVTCCYNQASALQYGKVNNSVAVDYSKMDIDQAMKLAVENFDNALKENNKNLKEQYLQVCISNYNIYTGAHPDDIEAVIQLARAYDMLKKDKYAKSIFFQALGINSKDIWANYYFGDFYYTRQEYRKALYYYREALKNGLEETPDNMKKMALIYEKFGDLYRANLYYKTLYLQNPSDEYVADKIREIESIKYQKSEYYRNGSK